MSAPNVVRFANGYIIRADAVVAIKAVGTHTLIWLTGDAPHGGLIVPEGLHEVAAMLGWSA